MADEAESSGHGNGMDNYKVRARCALLRKEIKEAEHIYLENVSLHMSFN